MDFNITCFEICGPSTGFPMTYALYVHGNCCPVPVMSVLDCLACWIDGCLLGLCVLFSVACGYCVENLAFGERVVVRMQQLDVYYQYFLNMFRSSLCPSSGGQDVCNTRLVLLKMGIMMPETF